MAISINDRLFGYILGGTGLVVGGLAGFFVGRQLTAKKFEQILNVEIQSVRDQYQYQYQNRQGMGNTPEFTIIDEVSSENWADIFSETVGETQERILLPETEEAKEFVDRLLEYSSTDDVPASEVLRALVEGTPTGNLQYHNVFDDPSTQDSGEEDDENEDDRPIRVRDDGPYMITFEEFVDDYKDYEKISLSYFEEDDTLIDDKESLIPNVEDIVGSKHLSMFGPDIVKYSQDQNIVYVRNNRLKADFEVIHEDGSYSENVLGIRPEPLRNNGKRPISKMRPDYD